MRKSWIVSFSCIQSLFIVHWSLTYIFVWLGPWFNVLISILDWYDLLVHIVFDFTCLFTIYWLFLLMNIEWSFNFNEWVISDLNAWFFYYKYFDNKYLNLMRMLNFVSLRLPDSHVGYALNIWLFSLTSYGLFLWILWTSNWPYQFK